LKSNNSILGSITGVGSTFHESDFLEIIEDRVCTPKRFSKNIYGVKQYQGKQQSCPRIFLCLGFSYLFGPGIKPDAHLPAGVGFGQMGMGDYDRRLASYCLMFAERAMEEIVENKAKTAAEDLCGQGFKIEDESVDQTGHLNVFLNSSCFCHKECLADSNGTGAAPANTAKPNTVKESNSDL
jgi:hypothetical protein